VDGKARRSPRPRAFMAMSRWLSTWKPSGTTAICRPSASSIAKSNYAGLRFREPVYFAIRELVMSYYGHYYNPAGEKTLRAYSTRLVNLKRLDRMNRMTTEKNIW
jgi:hypothetical protein